jgi:hypothetical protein
MIRKGLLCSVFVDKGISCCTNGATGYDYVRDVILVHPLLPEIFSSDRKTPAYKLVLPENEGYFRDNIIARPFLADKTLDSKTCNTFSFGGNFLWSSDSRFRKLVEHPIPVHDRYEPYNTYPEVDYGFE